MAAEYFVVINQQEGPNDSHDTSTGGTSGSAKAGCEVLERGLKSAKVVKIKSEAGTVAQAQEIARELYPSLCTGVPIVVTTAAWKES